MFYPHIMTRHILLNMTCSFLAALIMLYNMYNNHHYLVFLSCNTAFMFLGMDIWGPFEYKLWAILFTLGSFFYLW